MCETTRTLQKKSVPEFLTFLKDIKCIDMLAFYFFTRPRVRNSFFMTSIMRLCIFEVKNFQNGMTCPQADLEKCMPLAMDKINSDVSPKKWFSFCYHASSCSGVQSGYAMNWLHFNFSVLFFTFQMRLCLLKLLNSDEYFASLGITE